MISILEVNQDFTRNKSQKMVKRNDIKRLEKRETTSFNNLNLS